MVKENKSQQWESWVWGWMGLVPLVRNIYLRARAHAQVEPQPLLQTAFQITEISIIC